MNRRQRGRSMHPIVSTLTVLALALAVLPGATRGAAAAAKSGSAAESTSVAATGAWAQARFGPAHNAYNAAEQTLSAATVSPLTSVWSVPVSSAGLVLESSPTVAAGVVYLPTWDGHLVAADAAAGFLHWARSLPAGMFGSAPVNGRSVYTWLSDGTIRAYRISDGTQRWSVAEDNGGGIPSSSLTLAGNVLYGATYTGEVFARDARTGRQIWRFALAGVGSFFGSTVVWKGRVLAISSDDVVHTLDALTGAELWSREVPGVTWDVAPAVGAGGLAFVIDSLRGDLVALDATDGAPRWRVPIGRSAGITRGGYVAIGADRVYLTTSNDDVLSISRAGSVVWRRLVTDSAYSGGFRSQPVLANGLLWVTAGADLVALEARTGQLRLTLPTASVFGEPVVMDGRVYTAEADRSLHAYGLPSPSRSPSITHPSVPLSVPSVAPTSQVRPTRAERVHLKRLAERPR